LPSPALGVFIEGADAAAERRDERCRQHDSHPHDALLSTLASESFKRDAVENVTE